MSSRVQPNSEVLPDYLKRLREYLPPNDRDARRGGETWQEVRNVFDEYVRACVAHFTKLGKQHLFEQIRPEQGLDSRQADEGELQRSYVTNQSEMARVSGCEPTAVNQLLKSGKGASDLGTMFRLDAAFPKLKQLNEPVFLACQLAGRCAAVEKTRELLCSRKVYSKSISPLKRVEYVCLSNMYQCDGWLFRPPQLRPSAAEVAELIRLATEYASGLPAGRGDDPRRGGVSPSLDSLARLDKDWGWAYLLTRLYIGGNRGSEQPDANLSHSAT